MEKTAGDNLYKTEYSVLDGFFEHRSNGTDSKMTSDMIEDNMTTSEISDALTDMLPIESHIIVQYMNEHNYRCVTIEDGTVKWAIFRELCHKALF